VVLAVDILPSEIPKVASEDFSKSLLHIIPDIALCDFKESFKNLQVSEMIRRAIIVHRGVLTPKYQYLKEHLAKLIK
jgi:alpha-aminoadipic semialdehyde synthase